MRFTNIHRIQCALYNVTKHVVKWEIQVKQEVLGRTDCLLNLISHGQRTEKEKIRRGIHTYKQQGDHINLKNCEGGDTPDRDTHPDSKVFS
jgi:secreted PhoX family phosphatase